MKSKLIIIVSFVILFVIILVVINPFKKSDKDGDTNTLSVRGGGGGEVEVAQKTKPPGIKVEGPNLDVWEEETKEDLPKDTDRYKGERSKLRNSKDSTYYWKETGGVGQAKGNTNTQSNKNAGTGIQSGCYITKDYTNDFDIYKLAENAPILNHFYNQQIEDQEKRDQNIIPESKNRDYEFETDKNTEKYKKDQEAKLNPFFCMNVTTNPDNKNPNTDGCKKVEWDQQEWNVDDDNRYEKGKKGQAYYKMVREDNLYFVGTDIYRSKEEISQGKGVCKKYDENSEKYKGVPCKNVIG